MPSSNWFHAKALFQGLRKVDFHILANFALVWCFVCSSILRSLPKKGTKELQHLPIPKLHRKIMKLNPDRCCVSFSKVGWNLLLRGVSWSAIPPNGPGSIPQEFLHHFRRVTEWNRIRSACQWLRICRMIQLHHHWFFSLCRLGTCTPTCHGKWGQCEQNADIQGGIAES